MYLDELLADYNSQKIRCKPVPPEASPSFFQKELLTPGQQWPSNNPKVKIHISS